MLTKAPAEQCGLDPVRWDRAIAIARDWCERDVVPAVGLLVARNGHTSGPQLFGRQRVAVNSPQVRGDAIFLIASITKPIVCMGVMLLIERGQLTLNDRVTDFLPEFGKGGKYGTTIRHLLTHTSGLPDMLPNNTELRKQHASRAAFVSGTCELTPDFPAGRSVQYQSMGIAVLGAIIEKISGLSCNQFLRREFFEPLGMDDTQLGAPDDWFQGSNPTAERIAEIRLPPEQAAATDWNWNSRYWRQFGAPWGGLLTTPWDLGLFAQLMLTGGRSGDKQLLAPATVIEATRNQLAPMKDVPDEDRRFRPWGFGWRLQWASHANSFGDLVSPATFGHWGATGTMLWIDPESNAFALVLTTQPLSESQASFQRLSNAIVAALL
jgi:CubicO group peptidase (beta-lactamase class C family)